MLTLLFLLISTSISLIYGDIENGIDNYGCTLQKYIDATNFCTPRDVNIYNPIPVTNDDWKMWVEDGLQAGISIVTSIIDVATNKGWAGLVGNIINSLIDLSFNGDEQNKPDELSIAIEGLSNQFQTILTREMDNMRQCIDQKIFDALSEDKLQTISSFVNNLVTIYKYHMKDVNDLISEFALLVRDMDNFVAEKFDTFSYNSPAEYAANLPAFAKFVTIYEMVTMAYFKILRQCEEANKCTDPQCIDIECPEMNTAISKVNDDIQLLKEWIIAAHNSIKSEYSSVKALSAGEHACLSGTCDKKTECDTKLVMQYRWFVWNPQPYAIKEFGFWPDTDYSGTAKYRNNLGVAIMDSTDMDGDYLSKMILDMSGNVQMECELRKDMWGDFGVLLKNKLAGFRVIMMRMRLFLIHVVEQ